MTKEELESACNAHIEEMCRYCSSDCHYHTSPFSAGCSKVAAYKTAWYEAAKLLEKEIKHTKKKLISCRNYYKKKSLSK